MYNVILVKKYFIYKIRIMETFLQILCVAFTMHAIGNFVEMQPTSNHGKTSCEKIPGPVDADWNA